MIVSPDPPLDFNESVEVLRQVHLGGYVTVSVFEDQRGFPMFNLMGYLVRIDDIAAGALLVLRTQSHADAPVTERASNTLLIPRAEFRRGGESRDAEVPGPLAVEFGRYHVVITGRDVVPDWEALLR